jgi:hypothetical protein
VAALARLVVCVSQLVPVWTPDVEPAPLLVLLVRSKALVSPLSSVPVPAMDSAFEAGPLLVEELWARVLLPTIVCADGEKGITQIIRLIIHAVAFSPTGRQATKKPNLTGFVENLSNS